MSNSGDQQETVTAAINGDEPETKDKVSSSLEDMVRSLQGQIRQSDWLDKNSAQIQADKNPELVAAFKKALDDASCGQKSSGDS